MYMIVEVPQYVAVASFMEAWIEINCTACHILKQAESPPSRRRGLKWQVKGLKTAQKGRLLHGGED